MQPEAISLCATYVKRHSSTLRESCGTLLNTVAALVVMRLKRLATTTTMIWFWSRPAQTIARFSELINHSHAALHYNCVNFWGTLPFVSLGCSAKTLRSGLCVMY